jgi:HSP20 family protein
MLARQMLESSPIRQLRDEMDRLMEEFLGEQPTLEWAPLGRRDFPTVNVFEDEQTVFVEAELPGFKQDQIEITVAGSDLTISADRPELDFEKKAAVRRRERPEGRFARTIRLPYEVKDETIEATLHDGVLLITLPKAETCRTRKITVKALPG